MKVSRAKTAIFPAATGHRIQIHGSIMLSDGDMNTEVNKRTCRI